MYDARRNRALLAGKWAKDAPTLLKSRKHQKGFFRRLGKGQSEGLSEAKNLKALYQVRVTDG